MRGGMPGAGEGEKKENADETVGGKECSDEQEVPAASAQQMLQPLKVSCNC